MKKALSMIILFGCVNLTGSICLGDVLNFANAGFDDQVLSPGGYTSRDVSDWIGVGGDNGVWGVQYGNSGLPARSPNNWAYIANGDWGASGIGQLLMTGGSALRAVAGGTIDINLYQGHRTDYMSGDTQQFEIQIWRDAIGTGTLAYNSGDLGNATPGEWILRSISYTATGDDVGKDLYLCLYSPVSVQVQLEDVSGSYTVPEPATMSLLAAGAVFGLIRRKQR